MLRSLFTLLLAQLIFEARQFNIQYSWSANSACSPNSKRWGKTGLKRCKLNLVPNSSSKFNECDCPYQPNQTQLITTFISWYILKYFGLNKDKERVGDLQRHTGRVIS